MTPKQATKKVRKIKTERGYTDLELCEDLDMSKVTFYKRKNNDSWKRSEIALIDSIQI